jgi:hypothetical protein
MWTILEILFTLAIILVFITEFLWPILTGKPIFNSFRRTKEKSQKKKDTISLEEKVSIAKAKAEEIKTIQNEINENFKTAEQLKGEADDLLK